MIFSNPPVYSDALPRVAELNLQPHPVAYRNCRLLVLLLIFALLVVPVLLLFLYQGAVMGGIAGMVYAFGLTLTLIEELRGFPRRGYALRERDMTYRKGYFVSTLTTVPFNRIQHTEIVQGPLLRAFGLARIKVYTAGGSASDLSVSGLRPEVAAEIKEYITRKTTEDGADA